MATATKKPSKGKNGRSVEIPIRSHKVGDKRCRIVGLLPGDITVRSQMRKTFVESEIRVIALSILYEGQMVEALVNYVGDEHILIAGECRTRAIKMILEGKLDRVIGDDKQLQRKKKTLANYGVKCKVFDNLDGLEAFQLQIAENLRIKVPPDEEAEAIYDLWQQKLEIHPELTFKDFCQMANRGEDTVRNAIRFIRDLHRDIIKKVRKGDIPYGAGVIIARIPDADKQIFVARWIIEKNIKGMDRIRKLALPYIYSDEGQMALSVGKFNERKALRDALLSVPEKMLQVNVQWADAVLRAIEEGFIPQEIVPVKVLKSIKLAFTFDSRIQKLLEQRMQDSGKAGSAKKSAKPKPPKTKKPKKKAVSKKK